MVKFAVSVKNAIPFTLTFAFLGVCQLVVRTIAGALSSDYPMANGGLIMTGMTALILLIPFGLLIDGTHGLWRLWRGYLYQRKHPPLTPR